MVCSTQIWQEGKMAHLDTTELHRHEHTLDGEHPINVGGHVHQFEDRESGLPFSSFESTTRIGQIPALVAYLRRKAVSPSYIIFSTHRPDVDGEDDDQAINLQFAVENGVLGLEWVLVMRRNIEDKRKVMAFIKRRGHEVLERELNGIRYFRVENGDLPKLGNEILSDVYGVQPDTQLGLFSRWITWPPSWRAFN
jgi:hypothetical protein